MSCSPGLLRRNVVAGRRLWQLDKQDKPSPPFALAKPSYMTKKTEVKHNFSSTMVHWCVPHRTHEHLEETKC